MNSGLEVTGEVRADEVGSTVVLKHIYKNNYCLQLSEPYNGLVIISVLYLSGHCGAGLMFEFCCVGVGGVCTLELVNVSKCYTSHCQQHTEPVNCADIMQQFQHTKEYLMHNI